MILQNFVNINLSSFWLSILYLRVNSLGRGYKGFRVVQGFQLTDSKSLPWSLILGLVHHSPVTDRRTVNLYHHEVIVFVTLLSYNRQMDGKSLDRWTILTVEFAPKSLLGKLPKSPWQRLDFLYRHDSVFSKITEVCRHL